eukprot:scaffold30088_cov61-Phaeocystis_antarctica.AAC.3
MVGQLLGHLRLVRRRRLVQRLDATQPPLLSARSSWVERRLRLAHRLDAEPSPPRAPGLLSAGPSWVERLRVDGLM